MDQQNTLSLDHFAKGDTRCTGRAGNSSCTSANRCLRLCSLAMPGAGAVLVCGAGIRTVGACRPPGVVSNSEGGVGGASLPNPLQVVGGYGGGILQQYNAFKHPMA